MFLKIWLPILSKLVMTLALKLSLVTLKSREQKIRDEITSHLKDVFNLKTVNVYLKQIYLHILREDAVDSKCEEYYCDSIWERGVGKSTTTVNLALLASRGG